MQTVRGTVIEKIERAAHTVSVRFTLEGHVDFLPGQFLMVMFNEDDPADKSKNKYLSFSSSPTKEYIEVTKRLSDSEFSEHLRSLKIGDTVLLKMPMGNCVFSDDQKKIGFLIGGIGITPVVSIMEYIVDKGLTTDAVLFYSNRTYDDIAFRKELAVWAEAVPSIKVVHTVTDCPADDDSCFFGMVTRKLIDENIDDANERIWYIFGPPGMVNAMKGICSDAGCRINNIRAENFVGY